MKRFWIFITLAILTATQCSHPYEEGMLGTFPYLDMMTGTSASFTAGGSAPQKGEIKLSTNMTITTEVDYSGNDRGWISNISSSTDNSGITTIAYTVNANTRRFARKATIKILADKVQTGLAVTVTQEAYKMTGETVIYEGDLILRSQEDVDNCIYTKITGNLTITGDDIHDLSALEHIEAVGGNLIIEGCSQLSSLGPLNDLSVAMLRLYGTWAEAILENFMGGFLSLEIENCLDHTIDISVLTRFQGLESLRITGTEITNLTDVAEMTDLSSVTLLSCQVTQPEINYLEMLMPDTEFSIDFDYQTSFNLSATQVSEYYAEFRISVLFNPEPDLIEFGYILADDGEFDMSGKQALDGWYFGTFLLTVNALDPGQDYSIWIYGISSDNRYFLSEVETFTTTKVNYYTYTVTPEYPSWNGSSEAAEFARFEAYMITDIENLIHKPLAFDKTADGSQKATVPEGHLPIHMMAYNGGRGAGGSISIGADVIQFQVDETDGIDDDIVFATTDNTFDSDKTESLAFVRPFAKINVNVDFSESIGDISDIAAIDVTFDNMYKNWALVSDGSQLYDMSMTYGFSKSTDELTSLVNIASERYVLPHVEDAEKTAAVTITFDSGETVSTNSVLSEAIQANNIYDITLNVKLNRLNGTFEVDQVEIVDGGIIEF